MLYQYIVTVSCILSVISHKLCGIMHSRRPYTKILPLLAESPKLSFLSVLKFPRLISPDYRGWFWKIGPIRPNRAVTDQFGPKMVKTDRDWAIWTQKDHNGLWLTYLEGSFLSFWAQVSRSWSLLMILGHDYLRIFGNILFRIYLASFYLGFFDMLKIYFWQHFI